MTSIKRYSVMIAFVMITIVLSQSVLAISDFRAYSVVYDATNITRNYLRVSYTEENYLTYGLFGIPFYHEIDNYVPKGQPYEAYITYGLEPLDAWNSRYQNSNIDWCRIIVNEYHLVKTSKSTDDWSIVTSLNRTFTTQDDTVLKDAFRQFLILQKGEFARVYFDCHFTGTNLTIDTPTSITVTAPTFECKACQYYNQFKSSFDEVIGDAIETYSQRIIKNTNLFIGWNFEIVTTGFWILKGIILIAIIGIIFLGLWWLWKFLKSLSDRWK
jgi:hypothetical protein